MWIIKKNYSLSIVISTKKCEYESGFVKQGSIREHTLLLEAWVVNNIIVIANRCIKILLNVQYGQIIKIPYTRSENWYKKNISRTYGFTHEILCI